MSNEDIVDLLRQGASEQFGAEKLKSLQKILPSQEEVHVDTKINDMSPSLSLNLNCANSIKYSRYVSLVLAKCILRCHDRYFYQCKPFLHTSLPSSEVSAEGLDNFCG